MSDQYEEDEYDFDVAELDAAVASRSSKRDAPTTKTAVTATAAAKPVPASVALAPAASDEYADEFEVSKSSANAYGDDAFEEERSVSRAPASKQGTPAAATAAAAAKRASASVSTKAKPAAAPIKAAPAAAADADEYDVDDFDAAPPTRPGSAAVAKPAVPTAAAASVKAATAAPTPVKPVAAAAKPSPPAASAPSTPLKPAAAASAVAAVAAIPVPAAAAAKPAPVSSPRTLEPSYSQEHLPTASSAAVASPGLAAKPRPSDDGPVDYDNHAGTRPMSARPTSAHPSKSRPTSAHPSNSRPTSAANLPPAASSAATASTKPPAAKPAIPTVPKPATAAASASAIKPAVASVAPSVASAASAAVPAVSAKPATSMPLVAAASPTTPAAATKLATTTIPVAAATPVAAASPTVVPVPTTAAPAATPAPAPAVIPIPAASPSAALTHALLAAAGGVLPLESAGSILVRDEDDDDGDYGDDDEFEEAIAKAQKAPTSAVSLSATSRPTQQAVTPSSPVAVKPTAAAVALTSPVVPKPAPVLSPTSPVATKPVSAVVLPTSPVAAKAAAAPVVAAAVAPDTGARAVPSSKKAAPAAVVPVVARPPPPVTAAAAPVAPKTAPAPRKPAAAAAPTSPVAAASDPKKAAEYDRARREIMKAQRLKDAAEAKEKAKIAAREQREKSAAAAATAAEEEEKQEEAKRANKAPIQPPPALSPPTSPLNAVRSSSPSRTQPRVRKGQHQIHPHVAPPPWEHAAQFGDQRGEEEEEEEEKQQFSPRAPHSPSRSSNRARPPRYGAAATARPGTAASSYSFAPFSPSSSTARPSTSAAAFRVADAWSLQSGRRPAVDGALETQRLVHRAAEILRAFSETDPSPLVVGPPFQPLRRPTNATAHADVPRCYPRGAVQTPRVSTARFKRTRAFNGGLTGPQPHYYAQDRSAAIAAASALAGSRAARKGSWDVSAELSYGHAIIEGLRARTQTLASAVESRGISLSPHAPSAATAAPTVSLGLPPRPSSAQHQAQHHSDLLQSLAVTSSLESYYSLLSRLDISVQQSQQHENQLQQIMFQPTISMPPQPPSQPQQPQQPKRSPGSSRPGSAVANYRHTSDDASLLAAEQESGWVHPSPAAAGLHAADYSLKRPTSGRRTHPLAPPSQIPPYDSLLDPHVRSVLGPAQRRVIESTRQEDLADAPELRGMYETRSRNFDEEREVEESLRAEEIKRKRRQDRPQEERISQRPRSATGTSAASHKKQSNPSAPKRVNPPPAAAVPSSSSFAAIPPAPKAARDMPTRIKQVSSAYAAGNSAALPLSSKPKPRRPAAAAARSRVEEEKYSSIEIRDEGDDASDPADAADDEEDYLAVGAPSAAAAAPVLTECDTSLIVDWHALSSLWASDDDAGLLDRELASLGLLGEAVAVPLEHSARSGAASKSSLHREFFSAERCLQSLHAQLGLPFEVSAPASDFAPSLRHVAALKAAVSGLLDCKSLVVRIIETIGMREQIVTALNAGASATVEATNAAAATLADPVSTPMELLSQLAQADTALLDLLQDYSLSFRAQFGGRSEFCPPAPAAVAAAAESALPLPFVFRGEDYGLKVSRERAQLLHFYNAGREALEEGSGAATRESRHPASAPGRARSAARSRGDRVRSAARDRRASAESPLPAPDVSATNSSEAAIAHLAATHLHQRPPSEIASAAAAIVLGTIKQQARQQHSTSRRRG